LTRSNEILHGPALDQLKTLDSDSIDLIVTDPPYGYSFMNKDWDKAVVSADTWRACLRVLKPGAFAFIMSSPRQDVLCKMILNLIEAGFETNFTSLYWTYASGFPKAADVSKLVDKREGIDREVIGTKTYASGFGNSDEPHPMDWGNQSKDRRALTKPATEQAKRLEGSYAGFQPKPAVEVILTVMKPLSEKTFVDQALSNGKGVTWLDDCRIPYQSEQDKYQKDCEFGYRKYTSKHGYDTIKDGEMDRKIGSDDKGRFPANLLVEDDVLNDGKVTGNTFRKGKQKQGGKYFFGMIEAQEDSAAGYNDSGSFSRYFSLDSWTEKTLPFLIVPKAAKAEKDKGLEGLEEKALPHNTHMRCATCGLQIVGNPKPNCQCEIKQEIRQTAKNFHPTVKPLKLMSYLITMGSREGDIVLDPFCGSGTVLIAARQLARDFIGIEISQEYIEIANTRLKPYLLQTRLEVG
jgi:16S rRNA G966 N2-methylase RsmD